MGATLQQMMIKAYQDTIDEFEKLRNEMESEQHGTMVTRGRFLENLLEVYKNPRTKTVEKDTPETIQALEAARLEIESLTGRLASKISGHEQYDGLLEELDAIRSKFAPYLIICKKDGIAATYADMFAFMLNILHRSNRFILDQADRDYIKSQGGTIDEV